MYENIIQYIVNADQYYRLWMVAELQHPNLATLKNNALPLTQPRREWFMPLVEQFEDVRLVPAAISTSGAEHQLDSDMRFHTGNKNPTINFSNIQISWGDETLQDNPMRKVGPAYIKLNGLKMWHHQDTLHRRRGDAVICEQATFQWNTKESSQGAFRESGPFRVVLKGFRAAYSMGTTTDATWESMNVSWGTDVGIRLGESKVQDIINKNKIGINYLNTDSCFDTASDEFIFWDEIGRYQDRFK